MSPSSGDFTLLLEDLAPWEQGDQLTGCTPAQARDAAVNLAGLHGPRWCDPALLDIEGLSINGPDDVAELGAEIARLYRERRAVVLVMLNVDAMVGDDEGEIDEQHPRLVALRVNLCDRLRNLLAWARQLLSAW